MSNQKSSQCSLIEKRESQLWWLAVVIMLMLALALYFVDSANMPTVWWFSPGIEFALNTNLVRISLIASILLICAYFRQSAQRLRMENHKLIMDIEVRSAQLENKNLGLSRLKELSDKIIEVTDLQSALDLILGTAAELIHSDTASIMLRNESTDILHIVASRGLPSAVVELSSVRIGESLAGIVARDGKPLIIDSDDIDSKTARFAQRRDAIGTSAIVPINLSGEVHGVLCVSRCRSSTLLNDDDIEVLITLANQVALAIEKMTLLSNLKDQVQMLEAALRELEQAQAKVIQAEKLASIGQLAGGVAHEINNPLQVILGRTEMLLCEETDARKRKDLDTICEHTARIAEIVANLLNLSRQTKDNSYRSVDINDVVHASLQLLEHQMTVDDIIVEKDLQNDLAPVNGDPRQLQQVLTNLIQNAYQAMYKHGSGEILINTHETNDEIIVEIHDNGPGIPADALDHIFEPFFTTKPEGEGTGLGLSVSYGIVQAHGGQIQVESKVGNGTSFIVRLPSANDTSSMQDGASDLRAA